MNWTKKVLLYNKPNLTNYGDMLWDYGNMWNYKKHEVKNMN